MLCPIQGLPCFGWQKPVENLPKLPTIQGTFVPCALKNNSEEGGIISCDDSKFDGQIVSSLNDSSHGLSWRVTSTTENHTIYDAIGDFPSPT